MSASRVGQPGLIDALIDAHTQTSICDRCLPNEERAPLITGNRVIEPTGHIQATDISVPGIAFP